MEAAKVPQFVERIFLDPIPFSYGEGLSKEKEDPERCLDVCLNTEDGPQNPDWHSFRELQITASKVHAITHGLTPETRYNAWRRKVPFNEAIHHGITEEPHARTAFEKRTGFTVYKCGTITRPDEPWASATPDGLFLDKKGELACLEIKCPVSFKYGLIEANYFLDDKDRGDGEPSLSLKRSSSYFTQCQWQMYCTGAKTNHFFVYTSKDCHHEVIEIDHDFLKPLVKKAEKIHFEDLVPRYEKELEDARKSADKIGA